MKYWRPIVNWLRVSQTLAPILFAVVIGAGAGLGALLLPILIKEMHWLFFDVLGVRLEAVMGPSYPIVCLAAGGLIVGLMNRFFSSDTKGHAIPNIMMAVSFKGGRIPARAMALKALSATACIGSGGSAGVIGPVVRIGSAFGAAVGELFRLPDRRVIVSVACGAAGGIAAVFNAPIAGPIFALEILLGRFTALTFGLLVVSSTSAAVVSQALVGDRPPFAIEFAYAHPVPAELPLFALLGVCCALVGRFFTWSLFAVDDFDDRLPIPDFLKPAIGGALVGAVGIWYPQVFGSGTEVIIDTLNGRFLAQSLLILCVMKLVCTSLTIGSGGSGGIFAPALFLGAVFGAAFGNIAEGILPRLVESPSAYALVGMAALFAGAAHAPLTAIFIILELTGNNQLILPLLTATVISTLLAQRLSPESIYTAKLRRSGISMERAQDVNLADGITVQEAMTQDFTVIRPNTSLVQLLDALARSKQSGFVVFNDKDHLAGIVAQEDIEQITMHETLSRLSVDDVVRRQVAVCRPDQTITSALAQFGMHGAHLLPVIDPERPKHVIGVLHHSDVIAALSNAQREKRAVERRIDELSLRSSWSDTVLSEETVTAGSALDGTRVCDAGYPKEAILVGVKRANETIVPDGNTQHAPGDRLVVLTRHDRVQAIRKWLKEHC